MIGQALLFMFKMFHVKHIIKRKEDKKMNEIITIKPTELANKKLAKEVKNIATALQTIGKNKWKVADALRNVYDDELWKDDFSTDKELAAALGLSRPNMKKLVCASHYHDDIVEVVKNAETGDDDTVKVLDGFTVSAVMELLGIAKSDVVSFLDEYSITKDSTCKEIREAVKLYKDGDEEEDVNESDDTEDDADLSMEDVQEVIDRENVKTAIDAMSREEFSAFIEYAREGGYFGK